MPSVITKLSLAYRRWQWTAMDAEFTDNGYTKRWKDILTETIVELSDPYPCGRPLRRWAVSLDLPFSSQEGPGFGGRSAERC